MEQIDLELVYNSGKRETIRVTLPIKETLSIVLSDGVVRKFEYFGCVMSGDVKKKLIYRQEND